ncbi:MAG: hypothetical protein ACI9MC_000026 [Kiritimatiellia bacterium]
MRILLPLLLVLPFTGCDQIKQSIHDATSESPSSGGGNDGSGVSAEGSGGGDATPAAVGAHSTKPGGGGLIHNVLGPGGPAPGISGGQCSELQDGGKPKGPSCLTDTIKCGQTIIGHTKGGTNQYNTRFYERNTCWPGTRNHNGGDERVYQFVANDSPRFKKGEQRQRVTVWFDTPCADLTFSAMYTKKKNQCPGPQDSVGWCDSANPFTRKSNRNKMNMTVDQGEVYYFFVEGADEEEGPFSITLECGT